MALRRRDTRSPDAPPARRTVEELRAAGWVLPASLQRDDVVPEWTRLGVIDGATTAVVDPRGLVTPVLAPGHPSVDWWIGAEDRWYSPAQERGVTQERLEDAPVVETTLRVPGGTVVHRAYGARGAPHQGGDAWTVVEVENRSPVPVVLAWVVRPYSPVGPTEVGEVRLAPTSATVPDGAQALDASGPLGVLRRLPSRWADGDGADPWTVVTSGAAGSEPSPRSSPSGDGAGAASLALLTPLPHTATARLALVADPVPPAPGAGATPLAGSGVGFPADLPDASAIARGWSALARLGPRVELPDPLLAGAVAAARRSLPLNLRVPLPDGREERAARVTAGTGTGGPDPAGDAMEITTALAWWGDGTGAGRVVARWPDAQQRGGGFGSTLATVAAVEAMAAHLVATGDVGPATHWLPEIGGALEDLGRTARRARSDDDRHLLARGLQAGGVLLRAVDQPEAAARVDAHAADLRAAAAGPPAAAEDGAGVSPRALAASAVAVAQAGGAVLPLWAVLRRATPTWTWSDPERWVGDDGLVSARLLRTVTELLVGDGPDGLALTRWMPPEWWGQGWELHDAPTRWGRLSYAVRWHGERPALLWELDPTVPSGPWAGAPLTITAPGLDATWSTGERRGEALLAPVTPPADDPASIVASRAVAAPPRSVWRPQDPGPDAVDPGRAGPPPPPAPPDPEGDGGSFL